MQGIILAAGMGKRLKELTQNNTKCMVKVNGITLIERMLAQLEMLGLNRIVIVVGYEADKLVEYISSLGITTKIEYVRNEIYNKTNNIYSLFLAREYLERDDTLLLESDLIFEDKVLKCLIEDERDTLALVDKYESWMDGTCMKIADDDSIISFVPGSKFQYEEAGDYFKTVNIYKFSKEFSQTHYVPFLDAYINALGNNEYYEQVLKVITMLDNPGIKAKRLNGEMWYEIDDIQDLDIASSLFATTDEERLELFQERYGGYWRYPKLLDFCYLVNPYYPPKKMIDEMKSSFDVLLTQYPSGMKVNSLIAGKYFSINSEHIVVGNGAAEIIKSLMEMTVGNIGIIRPSFEEYAHRCGEERIVEYWADNKDFSYSVDDLIGFFDGKDISNIVLINPDNPSGNYIPKSEILRFCEWCDERRIRLILDESFVDFASENNATFVAEDIISKYKLLVVIKSISKSFGIPGIRLGILASADETLISRLKKDVAIWNINSFAEFFLQIAEKYRKNYDQAIEIYRKCRDEFIEELRDIPGIRAINSEANYVMLELVKDNMTSKELTSRLLAEKNILIKDLSNKIKCRNRNYIRLAVRNENDNLVLIEALKEILSV